MLRAISGIFGSTAIPELPQRYDHIAAAIKLLQAKPESPGAYRFAVKVAGSYGLAGDHVLMRSIRDSVLLDKRERLEPPSENVPKHEVQLSQKGLSPEEFILEVLRWGVALTSVEVTDASDELFQTLQAACPNLTTFIFSENVASPSMELSDQGLLSLAQMPSLTTLELNCFTLFHVTSKGFEALFESANLQANLVHLRINFGGFGDGGYALLPNFKKLETLSVRGGTIGYKTLSSCPISRTVVNFSLNIADIKKDSITDTFLNGLPEKLTHLSLAGSFVQVTPQGFASAMKRLSQLTHLSIEGTSIQSYMLKAMPSTLLSVRLGDTSALQPFDFVDFFNGQTALAHLHIGQAQNFDQTIPFPGTLKSLYLHAPQLFQLSAIPNTLEELTLAGIPATFVGYDILTQFKNLKTFRALNCPWFNRYSLQRLYEGSGAILTQIALIGVQVDNEGVAALANFARLHAVALGNLKATTEDVLFRLLADDRVAVRTRAFYFCDLYVPDSLAPLFTPFENLRLLFVGDSLIGFPGPLAIFKNPTLVRNGTEFSDWFGPSLYGAFQRELR